MVIEFDELFKIGYILMVEFLVVFWWIWDVVNEL